jgi:hypothetical protein
VIRSVKRHDDERLSSPTQREAHLDAEIGRMKLDGYTVLTRTTRHQAVMTKHGRKVHIYVDEIGTLTWL